MERDVLMISGRSDLLVGDDRIIASEVMSLRELKYKILHLVPAQAEGVGKEDVLLKSDSLSKVHTYFKVASRHLGSVALELLRKYNFVLTVVAWRDLSFIKWLPRIRREVPVILIIDNLRYVNPARIHSATGSVKEVMKAIFGIPYYNILSVASTLNVAVSRSCKNALIFKARSIALPPSYVEIYPVSEKREASYESIRQKLEHIKDVKSEGTPIVFHAKVFGPKKGIPHRIWNRALGFYSFISLYVMAKRLREYLFVTWDTTPQLFDFYLRSLNLSKLPDNIIRLPWIPQEYVNELYKLVDAVTIPRLGWHGYGVTTSLIEALYFGKPVLTTSNVLKNLGLDKLLHDGLIAEDNICAWSRLLKRMVEESNLKRLEAINRLIFERMFSLPVRVEKLKRVLEGLHK